MKNIALLIVFVVLNVNGFLYSQQISIRIQNANTKKAVLFSLQGEKTFLIDSIKATSKDKFSYTFDNTKTNIGIYRFSFPNNKVIDFIFDGNDVELQTDANNILDSMKVISSESNWMFYSFIKLNKQYKTKTELLQLILARYPKDDEYYSQTKKRLQEIQSEYLEFVNVTSQKITTSFIAKYIRSAQLPILDSETPIDKQLAYLKAHALDNVDFNNSSLIYSDAFTNKTIEYLTYYRNPQLPKELLEKEFVKAVDTLLNKAKVNQLVYQHITEYLIDGFKKFGFDQVLDYIVENYIIKDDLCLDVKTEGMIKRRIDQAKNFKIGSVVPNIILSDANGKEIQLSKINSDKILIVFYASWCPHCKELLPKLNGLYKQQTVKNFEILAIALDEKKDEWLNFVKDNCSSFINVSDLKGWEGKASNDYFIYATPTMIFVDNDKKIIAKPLTIEELKKIM